MKHLLTGVAMAAALAIAAPVWAQNAPMTPGGNNPTSGSAGPFAPKAAPPATPAPAPTGGAMNAKPMAAKPMHMHHKAMGKKSMHHVSHRRMMGGGDQMTEQLNAQELARITGGGGSAPAPRPMAPGGNNPTSGSAGPFAPPPPK
jgi:hypothetical protein